MKTSIIHFQEKIWHFYQGNGRTFPWRNTNNPYYVLVSEIMLQQTQTQRVLKKYESFLHRFPDIHVLACSSLQHVLAEWQGLGYNRRGRALHETARIIVAHHDACVPRQLDILQTFPGIGYATACSIVAFAFNTPVSFIETNIRSVFIHEFFSDRDNVTDKDILPLVEATLDHHNAREWYYALMDYGVFLKRNENPSRKSKHHSRQSHFIGSDRQIRGAVIRILAQKTTLSFTELLSFVQKDLARAIESAKFSSIVEKLAHEQMISVIGDRICIAG